MRGEHGLLLDEVVDADGEDRPIRRWRVTAPYLLGQRAARHMAERGGGAIVNISSVHSQHVWPNDTAYGVAKAALNRLTKSMAVEWARFGIRANAIAPGWFPSDMSNYVLDRHAERLQEHIPLRRFGGPDDLKGAVGYLASRAADFVTGHVLVVDGGQTLSNLAGV